MKRILIVLFLTAAGTLLFAQSEEMNIYNAMYDGSTSIAEQVGIIEQVLAAKPAGATEFFAKALNNLTLIYVRQTDKNEINAADRAAILLSRALGDAQYTDAGINLWYICQEFKGGQDTPLAKAAAFEALGKVNATEYIVHVVQALNDLNSQPPSDREMQIQNERMAYGAILGLENYRDQAGYDSVFIASLSWYSLRIRRQATESLSKIMEDPYEHLVNIINMPSYVGLAETITPTEVKYEALQVGEGSTSSDNHKAQIALAALYQGHNIRVGDRHQQEIQATTRKLALNMIRRYGIDDNSVYPLIDRSYRDGSHDEKLAALYALTALAGESSAELLSGYLRDLHSRRVADAGTQRQKQDEDSYVRVIIPALGQIGASARPYSPPVLRLIQNTNVWTGYVQGLAREALQKIGG